MRQQLLWFGTRHGPGKLSADSPLEQHFLHPNAAATKPIPIGRRGAARLVRRAQRAPCSRSISVSR